jgi:hypothetical protein
MISPDNYLKNKGLKSFSDPQKFWSWAANKAGQEKLNEYVRFLNDRARGIGLNDSAFYDFIAGHKIFNVAASFEYDLLKIMLEWAEPMLPKHGVIVELGCHSGLLSRFFAIARPEAHIIGIDISAQAIAIAEEKFRESKIPNIEFIQADLLNEASWPELSADCIITGRILAEMMSPKIRFQLSCDQFEYPPISDELDSKMAAIMQFCSKNLNQNGQVLFTERLSNYDRLNRLMFAAHKAGLGINPDTLHPIEWQDIAGNHSTWFFISQGNHQPLGKYQDLDPSKIALTSKSAEIINNETRILFKGLMALLTWRSIIKTQVDKKALLHWENGLSEIIELGQATDGLFYSFIGNNIGEYMLTLFLGSEHSSVKSDLDEYLNYQQSNGAKL